MLKSSLPLAAVCAAALALGACGESETSNNNTAAAQPEGAQEAGGEQTIAASLNENGRFFQAARAVGLDATLEGPGPYTVLVPADQAFTGVEGALADPGDPEQRAEITRILTYHILPGVILTEDIETAIRNGDGSAVLATMGGETLTARSEGGKIVLTDSAGGKATITQGNQQASNGAVHGIDAVLMPPAPGGQQQGAAAGNQQ